MPCPFTGPNMFWTRPKIEYVAFSASPKLFCAGTKTEFTK